MHEFPFFEPIENLMCMGLDFDRELSMVTFCATGNIFVRNRCDNTLFVNHI